MACDNPECECGGKNNVKVGIVENEMVMGFDHKTDGFTFSLTETIKLRDALIDIVNRLSNTNVSKTVN